MHKRVTPENKGMVVHPRHWCISRGTDVGKNGFARSICADASKIEVMKRRLRIFVKCRVRNRDAVSIEFRCDGCVPSYTKSIDVEQSVASSDFLLRGDFVRVMGQEFREEVVVNLFGKAMSLKSYQ